MKDFMLHLLAGAYKIWRVLLKWLHQTVQRIKANKKLCWYLRLGASYMLVILVFVLVFLAGARTGQKKALATYNQWFEEYKAEQELAAQEALAAQQENDPYLVQLKQEAEMVARVLYGVKDNSTDDLKTYCWCIFNRVDNSVYPSTVQDVIAQPQQWMRYDPSNPVLENLYQIAYEQLDEWYTNTHRPVSSDYVFMNWSTSSIVLRDNFYEGSGTHYWRWNQ